MTHPNAISGTTPTSAETDSTRVASKVLHAGPGPKTTPVKVKTYIEGSHRVTTKSQSPTADSHLNVGNKTVKTTVTEKYAGLPLKETVTTVETSDNNLNLNEYSGGKQVQTDTQISGRVDFSNHDNGANSTKRNAPRLPSNKSVGSPRVNYSASSKDAVRISSSNSSDAPDFDIDVSARDDAKSLHTAVKTLRDTLGAYGILPKEADLQVVGASDLNALTTAVQNDYMAVREGNIVVNYTDHRGGAFNEKLGNISITHRNIDRVTEAFTLANEAVHKMVTNVSPGQTISQEDISNTVRSTLKKELRAIQ